MQCPRCYTPMEEKDYGRVVDGKIWRCPPKQCRATDSLRKWSFFERSNLPLTKLTDIIYYLVDGDQQRWGRVPGNVSVVLAYSIKFTMRFTRLLWVSIQLSTYVACSSVSTARLSPTGSTSSDVCSAEMIANPVQIGGPGTTVAIDKSWPSRSQGTFMDDQCLSSGSLGGVQLGTDRFFMELV